jgi:hypothetical protein
MVRPGGVLQKVQSAYSPAVNASLGSFVRIGLPSSLFAEFGVQAELYPATSFFATTQWSAGPFIGFSTMGVFKKKDQ